MIYTMHLVNQHIHLPGMICFSLPFLAINMLCCGTIRALYTRSINKP